MWVAAKNDEHLNQQNNRMQRIESPQRIERILSPPQVSVKDEDDEEVDCNDRNLIVSPFATMKSLVLINDILVAAT